MPGWLTEARVVAASIVAAGLAFIVGSFQVPIGTLLAPGPGLVPLFLGCATLAAMIAVVWVRDDAAPAVQPEPPVEPVETAQQGSAARLPHVPVILAALGLCLLAFESAGFVPAIFVSTFLLLFVLERRSLLLSVAVSSIMSVGLFLLFERVLHVTMPRGLLEFWP